MFVSTIPEHKTGRKLIVFAEKYHNGIKYVARTVEKIGYLDELIQLYDDPIAHFKNIAAIKSEEIKEAKKNRHIDVEPHARLPFSDVSGAYNCMQNIGYAAISKILYELGIPQFIDARRKYLHLGYNLTAVLKLLIFERLLFPDSKRSNWFHKERYFDKMDFDLNSVYRSLSIIGSYRENLLIHLNNIMVEKYNRETTLMFYDVTNYYFEIDNEDSFRRNGVSKENKPTPIIQMGLFMDANGFPVTYDLYPGNTKDSKTFTPMTAQLRKQLQIKHVIFVADKGMMEGDNIADVITHHNGYVFSKAVRGASGDFQKYVKDPQGYIRYDAHGNKIADTDKETEVYFMYKVSNSAAPIYVKDIEGDTQKIKDFGQYRVIYWSRKYAQRAKLERAKAVEKAMYASHTNSKDVVNNNHGKNRYLKTEITDPKTGKIVKNYKAKTKMDFEQLEKDESLDGYNVIETNVTGWRAIVDAKGKETGEYEKDFGKEHRWLKKEGMFQLNKIVTPRDIIDMYKGLWKIEQTFRITKSELNTRPIYVSRKDRIDAHFLTCFISLLIVKILEQRTGYAYSTEELLTSLKNANVAKLDGSNFLTLYYDKTLQSLKETLGINFGQNMYTKAEIKKMIGDTKK